MTNRSRTAIDMGYGWKLAALYECGVEADLTLASGHQGLVITTQQQHESGALLTFGAMRCSSRTTAPHRARRARQTTGSGRHVASPAPPKPNVMGHRVSVCRRGSAGLLLRTRSWIPTTRLISHRRARMHLAWTRRRRRLGGESGTTSLTRHGQLVTRGSRPGTQPHDGATASDSGEQPMECATRAHLAWLLMLLWKVGGCVPSVPFGAVHLL